MSPDLFWQPAAGDLVTIKPEHCALKHDHDFPARVVAVTTLPEGTVFRTVPTGPLDKMGRPPGWITSFHTVDELEPYTAPCKNTASTAKPTRSATTRA